MARFTEEEKMLRRIDKRFSKGVVEYGLIEDGDKILIGLSGGKDSLALVELLARRARVYKPRFSVVAVHVVMKNIPYQSDVDYLTEEELMQFVQLYYQRTLPEKLQLTLAFFLFMCFTSMHITDARMFCIEQVNNDVLTYYRVKNRNCKPEPIKIPMPVPAEKLLEEWAEGREEGRLFRNVQCDQVVNRQLKAIAKELGINKKISAKTGRHTFATIYLRKTKDLSSLQKLLGHSNIRETMIYAHVMDESKREGMQCFNSFTL